MNPLTNPMSEWQSFYTIVGSAAGGLTGLQFVAMALIADMPLGRAEAETGTAFSTPSLVYFGTVLLLAAVLVMPWHGVGGAAIVWGLAGLGGLLFTLFTLRRFTAQKAYKPVLEDWIFRVASPAVAYAAILVSAVAAHISLRPAMFALAGAALLLLFIGIHNAWDNVTYLVFVKKHEARDAS